MNPADSPRVNVTSEARPVSGFALADGTVRHTPRQTPEELKEEERKIRRLRIVVDMVMQVIAQDPTLAV